MRNNMKSFFFTVLLFCSIHVHKSSVIRPSVTQNEEFVPAIYSEPLETPSTENAPDTKPNGPRETPSTGNGPFTIPNAPRETPSTENAPITNPNTPRLPPVNPNTLINPKEQRVPPRPPSSDDSEPLKIPGLARTKQYLNDFGYLNNATYSLSDILDSETISAIKTYQKFFNLDITGQIDNQTLNQMSLPRCYVPDLNVVYDLNSETNVNWSWPQGIRWFPNGTSTNHLTYGFLPENKISLNFQTVFTDSFNRWSEAIAELSLTKLNFTETNYNTSDIKIGFYILNNSIVDAVAGTTMRYQDGSYNGNGNANNNGNKVVADIRLDGSKYWILPGFNGTWSWLNGQFDLGTVAMHQVGHILGLSHSPIANSVMYPSILATNERKVELTADDKNNILNVFRGVPRTTISSSAGAWGLCICLVIPSVLYRSCALLCLHDSSVARVE
ncbi:unnamed protein product [Lupinus luteus]|uniref:Peptidase metallopeptidase domain-containing protein n=1 Tax=Lupinus luteus TaxID=3873 RepID=A0AAV1YF10_LUPLU